MSGCPCGSGYGPGRPRAAAAASTAAIHAHSRSVKKVFLKQIGHQYIYVYPLKYMINLNNAVICN